MPKKGIYIVVWLIIGGIVVWSIAHLFFHRNSTSQDIAIISHRGAAGLAPENTIVSLKKALNHGADYVEIDIQKTSDGKLILMHDKTVNRTTDGIGAVNKLTSDEIMALDAGNSFSFDFAGESVPLLDDALRVMTESSATLVIEAKNPKLYPGIGQQIIETVERFEATDKVIVVSLDHKWLRNFDELETDISIGYLYVTPPLRPHFSEPGLVDVYWVSVVLDPTLIWRMHKHGHQVWVWTVNSPRLINLLVWLGVDGITTDRPDLLTATITYD